MEMLRNVFLLFSLLFPLISRIICGVCDVRGSGELSLHALQASLHLRTSELKSTGIAFTGHKSVSQILFLNTHIARIETIELKSYKLMNDLSSHLVMS